MTSGDTPPDKSFFGDGMVDAIDIQGIVTVLVSGGTFFGGWFYAITAWGWFLGLALGWIPAAILAAMAGFAAYRLWGLLLVIVAEFTFLIITGV